MHIKLTLTFLFISILFFSDNALAKKIYVTCDPPEGQRYDFLTNNKKWEQVKDGFSGSHPTFFYDDSKWSILNSVRSKS